MATPRRPLGSLYPRPATETYVEQEVLVPVEVKHHSSYLLLVFVLLTAIITAIFYYTNWSLVQNRNLDGTPTGQVNFWKCLFIGIILAGFICLVLWFLRL